MRSKENNCGSCAYGVKEGTGVMCHRYPPKLLVFDHPNAHGGQYVEAQRPWLDANEWCGEWVFYIVDVSHRK